MSTEQILFYRVNDPYGFFSNFSKHPILIEGFAWPTVEHYFQASKFNDYQIKDKIRSIESPMEAAKEGRNRNNPLRPDWDEMKEQVMLKALHAKYYQHPKLTTELLKTGDAIIIEHTNNDFYWADGGNGEGKNRLGFLLMEVRSEMLKYADNINFIFPPWIAFPEVDREDMFWRMGHGDEYLEQWESFLETINLEKYKDNFPEPENWSGAYYI